MCTKKRGKHLGTEKCYESWGDKVQTELSDAQEWTGYGNAVEWQLDLSLQMRRVLPRHALRHTWLLWLKGWHLICRLRAFAANEATNSARYQAERT
jgi:hypothetical protein